MNGDRNIYQANTTQESFSSRMRTTHFLPDVSTRGGSSEQDWRGLQMSLEGGLCTVRFHVWRWVCVQWGLISEQARASAGEGSCKVRSNASWLMVTWDPVLPPVKRQTPLKTLLSWCDGKVLYLCFLNHCRFVIQALNCQNSFSTVYNLSSNLVQNSFSTVYNLSSNLVQNYLMWIHFELESTITLFLFYGNCASILVIFQNAERKVN